MNTVPQEPVVIQPDSEHAVILADCGVIAKPRSMR